MPMGKKTLLVYSEFSLGGGHVDERDNDSDGELEDALAVNRSQKAQPDSLRVVACRGIIT